MNMTAVEAGAATRDEHVGGDWMVEELLATREVVGQNRAGGRMNRHQPPLTELGAANRQDRLIEVDVGKLEVQRFGQAHTRHTEQADQAVEHLCARPWLAQAYPIRMT